MKEPLYMVVAPGGRLSPADPLSHELILTKLKQGVTYKITLTDRGGTQHRLATNRFFYGGLNLLHQNLPEQDKQVAPTLTKLRDEFFLVPLGYKHREHWVDLTVKPPIYGHRDVADSIAFSEMSDEDFDTFVELSRALCVKLWGVDYWQEWAIQNGYDP